MSSIWDNTYTLGNTSATTLSAGPGIKIDDQSTPGVIKVSNDETVLWSGANTGTTAISLSEPLSSFERFRVIGGYGSTDWPETEFDTSTNLNTPSMNLLFARAPGGFQWFKGNYNVSNDTKNISAVSARRLYLNEGDTTIRWDSYGTYIKRVIGINRKQNGGN